MKKSLGLRRQLKKKSKEKTKNQSIIDCVAVLIVSKVRPVYFNLKLNITKYCLVKLLVYLCFKVIINFKPIIHLLERFFKTQFRSIEDGIKTITSKC